MTNKLRSRLGLADAKFRNAGFQIAYAIQISKVRGELFYAGGTTVFWNKDCRKVSEALQDLSVALPRIIEDARGAERDLALKRPEGDSDLRYYKQKTDELDAFADTVRTLISDFKPPPIKSTDSRALWHKTAKLFANFIEADLRTECLRSPTRDSSKSPLVVAVKELLEMAGRAETEDAVRKALVGKSARK